MALRSVIQQTTKTKSTDTPPTSCWLDASQPLEYINLWKLGLKKWKSSYIRASDNYMSAASFAFWVVSHVGTDVVYSG